MRILTSHIRSLSIIHSFAKLVALQATARRVDQQLAYTFLKTVHLEKAAEHVLFVHIFRLAVELMCTKFSGHLINFSTVNSQAGVIPW